MYNMNDEFHETIINSSLESHPNYFIAASKARWYRRDVIVNKPDEKYTVGDIILYDGVICTSQYSIDDSEPEGSMNSHIKYLNSQGYFLFSEKAILKIHSDKMKLRKAKQILKGVLFSSIFFIIPTFGLYSSKSENTWLVVILFISVLSLTYSILNSAVFDIRKEIIEALK